MENFILEYDNLLKKDIYITKKMLDDLFYSYDLDIINDDRLLKIYINNNKLIENHNNNFINNKLKEYDDYFNNMYKNVDSSILLDQEQRKIILSDDDNTMVIAGAGSGKTTTIASKVKYLVDKINIDPRTILILSFTNKSTEDLIKRIKYDFNIDVDIFTFHKLGMKIIKNKIRRNTEIVTDIKKIIDSYFLNVFEDKKKLKKIIKYFNNYFSFDDKVYKYKTFNQYYNYYANKMYLKNIFYLKKINDEKITNNLKMFKSIEGIKYGKLENILIANYLYVNNIKYKYEFDNFLIYEDVLDQYRNIIKNDYYSSFFDILMMYFERKKYLKKINSFNKEKTNKEIFFKLMENEKENLYNNFTFLVTNFINKYKNSSNTNIFCSNDERLIIIKEILDYYENYKLINNKIDFYDMIELAYKNVDVFLKYKYIIVDEYQDISVIRFKLVKKMVDVLNAKLLVVGDDFQSIFSFSGSNVKLFVNFYDLMGNASIKKITKTYRNSQQLIDIAGFLVMKNNDQIKKQLISEKSLDNPILIIRYEDKIKLLNKILNEITGNILLLGRYNSDVYSIIDNKIFKYVDGKVLWNNKKIDFMTIHASKGLGYDNVILLNCDDSKMGFPSKIEDDELIKMLSYNNQIEEERRLLYVALTRTKNRVYIMCFKNESIFIKEIENLTKTNYVLK